MKPRPYKVGFVGGQPNFDSLPVAKITDYPLEPRDYKPFAQSILGVSGQALFLRMWAFEVSPEDNSSLVCALYPYPGKPEQGLALQIWHEGDASFCQVTLLRGGKPVFSDAPEQLLLHTVETAPHNGEDLQGIYWGRSVTVPLDTLREMGGEVALAPGDNLPGNFFKIGRGSRAPHMGSHFAAQFPDDPYGRQSMGVFCVVGY